MKEIRNSDNRRVFDITDDGKTIIITIKGCKTIIRANLDGTFSIINIKVYEHK